MKTIWSNAKEESPESEEAQAVSGKTIIESPVQLSDGPAPAPADANKWDSRKNLWQKPIQSTQI